MTCTLCHTAHDPDETACPPAGPTAAALAAQGRDPNTPAWTAKYPGTCGICHRPIRVKDDLITWAPDGGAAHLDCVDPW